jgi:hypothetical protein
VSSKSKVVEKLTKKIKTLTFSPAFHVINARKLQWLLREGFLGKI